jgi:hypothetical protein
LNGFGAAAATRIIQEIWPQIFTDKTDLKKDDK